MRIAEVIGTVTQYHAAIPVLTGMRWIIGVPCSLKALKSDGPPDGEDVVIMDEAQRRARDTKSDSAKAGKRRRRFFPTRSR